MGSGEDETDCQEVKPRDRDRNEGMDGRGLGIACEMNREGGEKRENICSVYLLRSKMHDHNPPLQSQRLSLSLSLLPSFFFLTPSLSLFPSLSLTVFLSSLFPYPSPSSVISHLGEDDIHSHA